MSKPLRRGGRENIRGFFKANRLCPSQMPKMAMPSTKEQDRADDERATLHHESLPRVYQRTVQVDVGRFTQTALEMA